MRAWVRAAGVCLLATAAGCTSTRVQQKPEPVLVEVAAPAPETCARTTTGEPWASAELGLEIDRPEGDEWALAENVVSPMGNPIPVVVAHPASGAQIVMQVSEGMETPEALATMLRARLGEEGMLELGEPEKLDIDCGAEAYGFTFNVAGEADGRVALVQLGDSVVLIVASWPPQTDGKVVKDIDGVVRSVRAPGGATPTLMRPDKA